MSGVYGQAIEFLYNEFSGKSISVNVNCGTQTKRHLALGIGAALGVISAIGCYWENLNILNSLIKF